MGMVGCGARVGPVAEAVDDAIVIELADGRRLPWRMDDEEPVLVIANTLLVRVYMSF